MAMAREAKPEWVSDLNSALTDSRIVLVTQYQGLNVAQMSELRSQVRGCGVNFKVTKNRLTKLALKGTDFEDLSDMFTGPTAIAYSDDSVAAAKVISKFANDNEKLVLVGGKFGDHIIDVEGIKQLAKMPSLDELRAKIIALINTPATRLAGVTQAPAGQLARVMGAYAATGN